MILNFFVSRQTAYGPSEIPKIVALSVEILFLSKFFRYEILSNSVPALMEKRKFPGKYLYKTTKFATLD